MKQQAPPAPGWKAALTRLVGLSLLALALLLAWSRAPERPAASLVERWAQRPSQFVELPGGLVFHIRDEGPESDAQPLVLLHGLGGSLHDWDDWAAALRRTHRVIRVDLPGSGLTDAAPGDDYRPGTDARWVLALLEQRGVKAMRLVGQGRGGEVAAQMALLVPSRVQRLLLVAGAPQRDQALPAPLRWALRFPWPRWFVSGWLPRTLVDNVLRRLYGDPSLVTAAQVDRRQELLQREGNRWALLQQWRQLLNESQGTVQLARLDLPVMLLWGTADRVAPISQARVLQSWIEGSALLQVDGAGHLPQEEAPARSLAAAQPFIEGP
ncbi:alpha/beta fold hydrolase [Azohydromonas aeria]|uniref:alpha/beta fold hydrolase n=1 Tax=Azohydromonas aeria TaxID=2590212 RepID=UPI0012F9DC10|nr:alpha/beta fold hydrolase [Azohydromonas aeria]